MNNIYFDNASTTYPKPESVISAVCDYMTDCGANLNRGDYKESYDALETVYDCRELLSGMFGNDNPKNVVFTSGNTSSLNIVINGMLKDGDHVIVSSLEHNAMIRPLVHVLGEEGFSIIPCDECGNMDVDAVIKLIRPNTKAIMLTHASNVCGTINPIEKLGDIAKNHNLKFIVDAAQTAGVIDIDVKRMHIDGLCLAGHKGLLGPQGVGAMILSKELSETIPPMIYGGTGSVSHLMSMPEFMPDKFEAGTLNIPGIFGLKAGIEFIMSHDKEYAVKHERNLVSCFLELYKENSLDKKYRLIGRKDTDSRIGVISVVPKESDPSALSIFLEKDYRIRARVGLCCAPLAHKALNTYPLGTVRFSFGLWNSEEEVKTLINALRVYA